MKDPIPSVQRKTEDSCEPSLPCTVNERSSTSTITLLDWLFCKTDLKSSVYVSISTVLHTNSPLHKQAEE